MIWLCFGKRFHILFTVNYPFQAYVVFGQFLLLKKEKDLFVDWLKVCSGWVLFLLTAVISVQIHDFVY